MIRVLTESEAKDIRELLRSASARRERRQFVIEGPHLLEMAIERRAAIDYCAFTEEARQDPVFTKAESAGIAIRSLSAKLARRISDTEAPQGIFAVVRVREPLEAEGNILLALDAVQDPGNVGTLLRTAAWFGVRSVLLGEGSADAYNPKVIRGTQGAIFSLDVHERVKLPDVLRQLTDSGYSAIATVLDPTAMPVASITVPERSILVLGNEAHGISPEVLACCTTKVYIPKRGLGESLNVAISGAIVLYHLTAEQSLGSTAT